MANSDIEIGSKSSWASLDNAGIVSITPKSGYYSLGEEGKEQCELMSFSSFKSEQTYKVWENEDVYDTFHDAVNSLAKSRRASDSMGLRISSSYFQSGTIKQISLYYDKEINFIRNLRIAIFQNGVYKVVGKLKTGVTSEIYGENLRTLGIDPAINNITVFRDTFEVDSTTPVILDESFLSDSTAALFIFGSNKFGNIGNTFTHKDVISNPNEFITLRTYCCYRSLKDSISFFYDINVINTTQLINFAPVYIPFFDYTVVTNIVEDHTTDNFKKYHPSAQSLDEMERLSYSAPFIEGIRKINRANACFKRIYISHETLLGNMHNDSQRPSRFGLGGKLINKLSIPFNYGNMWIQREHDDYYRFGLDSSRVDSQTGVSKDYGIAFIPLSVKIAVEDPDNGNVTWHKSVNAVSQLTTLAPRDFTNWLATETIWDFDFNGIEYKNNGVWIEVENNLKEIYPFNNEEITLTNLPYDSIKELAISYYQAAFSENNDYIRISAPKRGYTTSGNNEEVVISTVDGNKVIEYLEEDVPVVAPVKIYFDFHARENWYDFIDEHVYQSSLYSYKTVNPSDGLTSATNHNMSSATINGDFVPKIASNKGFYLNAVTFLNVNNNFTNNANTYWLLIEDGDKRYISKNGIKVRNGSKFTPTWLFDLDEKINFNSSAKIRVGLTKTNDINSAFDDIKTPDIIDNGIELKCYQTADRECIINRTGVDDSPDPQRGWVPTILFSFRCNELDDMAQRIANLENLIISLTTVQS